MLLHSCSSYPGRKFGKATKQIIAAQLAIQKLFNQIEVVQFVVAQIKQPQNIVICFSIGLHPTIGTKQSEDDAPHKLAISVSRDSVIAR
jgi:hypothetical protein